MSEDRCYLKGEVTKEQVIEWKEEQWRAFLFNQMVETNIRLSKLEGQASWRNVLTSIPWAIVGAIVVALIK